MDGKYLLLVMPIGLVQQITRDIQTLLLHGMHQTGFLPDEHFDWLVWYLQCLLQHSQQRVAYDVDDPLMLLVHPPDYVIINGLVTSSLLWLPVNRQQQPVEPESLLLP